MNLKEAAQHILSEVANGRDGSYSFNYEEPTTGYYVGGYSYTLVGTADTLTDITIEHYLEDNRCDLSFLDVFVGWWTHNGRIYVDISRHTFSEVAAIALGRAHSQISIWDISNNKEVIL